MPYLNPMQQTKKSRSFINFLFFIASPKMRSQFFALIHSKKLIILTSDGGSSGKKIALKMTGGPSINKMHQQKTVSNQWRLLGH